MEAVVIAVGLVFVGLLGKAIFGGNKSGLTKEQREEQKRQNFLKTVPRGLAEVMGIIVNSGEISMLEMDVLNMDIAAARYDEARRKLRSAILPRLSPATFEAVMAAGGGEQWGGYENLKAAGLTQGTSNIPANTLFLGELPVNDGKDSRVEVRFAGEGHLLTIAPTGAGKGQRFILPNAFMYRGAMLCIDPKGEVYNTVAWRRSLMGKVFKFAPFDPTGDTECFNPLDFVKDWDDARVLADLLIVMSGKGDPFWESSARDLVRALIMYVKKTREPELRTLRELCRLLSPSKEEFEAMLDEMKLSGEELLLEQANILEPMSEGMRSSIYQSVRAQMDVWRSDKIAAATSSTSDDFHPSFMMNRMYMEEMMVSNNLQPAYGPYFDEGAGGVVNGCSDSVFLILPPDKMSSFAPVLRVITGVFINELQKVGQAQHKPQRDMLFILDELPQLGYMSIIENAVAIARSACIKLWFFTQDLAQLKQIYPRWESIISNCKVQIFFQPGDLGTANYLSERLGRMKNFADEDRPLASPQELIGEKFAGKAVLLKAGAKPFKCILPEPFYKDENFQTTIRNEKVGAWATPERERRRAQQQALK